MTKKNKTSLPNRQLRKNTIFVFADRHTSLPNRQLRNYAKKPKIHKTASLPNRQLRKACAMDYRL